MDPFLGEIRLFPFGFAPSNWALCNGQTLSISRFTALYSLLGTVYGGDGRSTFGLPNLQGRVMVGAGQGPGTSNYNLGQSGGATTVTLQQSQMAAHAHSLNAVNVNGSTTASSQNQLAASAGGSRVQPISGKAYASGSTSTTLSPTALSNTGNGGPHNNMQPYLVLNYCIALLGIYPQRP